MEMTDTSAVYTIWLRELKRFFRAKPRIIGNLMMPFIWFAIIGVGLNSSFVIPDVRFSYLNFMTPGIIGMSLLFTSIFSAVSVIWEKQFGFLKEILVSPVSRTSIVIGKIVGSTTVSLISALIFLAIAVAFNGVPLSGLSVFALLKTISFMTLISFSFVSIGLVLASKLTNMEGFQVVMSMMVMPLFFLSGAFFPLENAPAWMQAISYADPLMYGVDGLRGSLLGLHQHALLVDVSVLAAFSLFMIIVATFAFRRIQ